jgi:hypothetical protein
MTSEQHFREWLGQCLGHPSQRWISYLTCVNVVYKAEECVRAFPSRFFFFFSLFLHPAGHQLTRTDNFLHRILMIAPLAGSVVHRWSYRHCARQPLRFAFPSRDIFSHLVFFKKKKIKKKGIFPCLTGACFSSVWNDAPHDLFRWVVEQNPFDFGSTKRAFSPVYLFFFCTVQRRNMNTSEAHQSRQETIPKTK